MKKILLCAIAVIMLVCTTCVPSELEEGQEYNYIIRVDGFYLTCVSYNTEANDLYLQGCKRYGDIRVINPMNTIIYEIK